MNTKHLKQLGAMLTLLACASLQAAGGASDGSGGGAGGSAGSGTGSGAGGPASPSGAVLGAGPNASRGNAAQMQNQQRTQ
ncbi:MAG: hypothetical protein KA414_07465, partial [Limnohabitans sp.]|nr:hypothetical protein [Limnohabitans sp.]